MVPRRAVVHASPVSSQSARAQPEPEPEGGPEPGGSVLAEVLRLAWPAVLTSLLQTVVFLADRIMLGRHGAVSLASMQISGAVLWSAFSVFFGAMIGTVALVARRVGAGERDAARGSARTALRLAMVVGLGLAVLGSLGAGWIAGAMAPPGEGAEALAIEAAAGEYMRVFFLAEPLIFVGAAGALILNGSGDTRTPFRVGLVSNLANVAANYLLIFGAELGPLTIPELGATGAALGSVLAYVIEAALILRALHRPSCPVRIGGLLRPRVDPGERVELRRLLRLSSPAVAERVVIHAGYIGFAYVVTILGAQAMAANQALLTLESICFLGAEGFGVAAATVVGQSLGRRDPTRSSRGAWVAAGCCALALTACGLLIWATGPWTLPAFVAPDERGEGLVVAAMMAMPLLVLAQPAMATAVVLGHGLRGAGDTRSPVIAAAVGGLLLRVGGAWLLAVELGMGLRGIWLATALDWFVRSSILAWVFVRGRWTLLDLE